MNTIFRSLLAAACIAALPLAAQAQARKPAAKPVAKPVTKPTPAAPARAAQPAPAPAPAPARSTTPTRSAAASSSSDDPFDVGTNALNIGIGVGNRYSYGYLLGGNSSISPAFSVSFEHGIVKLGPGVLGVGAFVGYQSASYEYSSYKDKYTDLVVMVRAAYHYPVTDKFDAYGGVGLGVRRVGYSSGYTGPYSYDYGSTGAASGLFVGGRYYFTPNIGVFSELGYDQSFIKVGLAVKF